MSLNPVAPAILPHYQSSSDPPISLCNSTTTSLPLARKPCKIPPQIIPFHAPSNNQPITEGTFILSLIQPRNQSKQNTAAHQPPPGSSSLLPSPLQHQANCLQAMHKPIQQFNQHLKVEHINRQNLQLLVLQLQIDFALLRYLLFSSVGTISNKDFAVENSATSLMINPNPNPTSTALLLPRADAPKLRRFTPLVAEGPPIAKTNNTSNADFQPTPNTQEAHSITLQNLTPRISKLKKLFADEIATCTSITAGIHSQCFFLYDIIRQFEPGNTDVIIRKIPSVKFVFDFSKVTRPSSDPLIEPATGFSSPTFFCQTLPL